MNRKQRDLLIYAQGMIDGLLWDAPDAKSEAYVCVLEKLEEILKIEDAPKGTVNNEEDNK